MAASYDSLRLRNQRAMDRRLTADHRQLARALAGLVLRAATNRDEAGQPILPPSRKALDDLKAAAWERVLKPYYVGNGTDALDGPNPRSPYALLLVEGIAQATRIQAERQAALVRRLVKDREVVRWLTGPRPMLPTREMQPTIAGRITELTLTPTRDTQAGLRGVDGRIDTERARAALVRPRGTYDAFHQWVDPNGYRLSDRIWRTGIDVRSRIDLLLDYEVARGTGAVAIANMLEPFLTPGGAAGKTVKPYGREGSYSARRLARTEITAAAGRATVNAAAANPFVAQLRWRLSASHPKIDICDDYARGGLNGDGIYDIDKLPQYPPHPHCLCSILPVPSGSTADLVQTLRADIQAARGNLIDAASGGDPARARALQGTLSPEYLTQAMMTGNLDDAVAQAVRQAQTVRPDVPRAVAPGKAMPIKEPPKPWPKDYEDWRTIHGDVSTVQYDTSEGARIRQALLAPESVKRREKIIADYNRTKTRALEGIEDKSPQESAEIYRRLAGYESELKTDLRSATQITNALELPDKAAPDLKAAAFDREWDKKKRAQVERPAELDEEHQEALDFVNRITERATGDPVRIVYRDSERAMAGPNDEILVSRGWDDGGTIAHEIGHVLERRVSQEDRRKISRWMLDRFDGEAPVNLRELFPDDGYGETERAIRDKFVHPYVGRLYTRTDGTFSTEVISVGLQQLHDRPWQFAEEDPDMFDFVVSFLKGTL